MRNHLNYNNNGRVFGQAQDKEAQDHPQQSQTSIIIVKNPSESSVPAAGSEESGVDKAKIQEHERKLIINHIPHRRHS
jgi:hypothetical protein